MKKMDLTKMENLQGIHLHGCLADEATAAAGDPLGGDSRLEKEFEAGPSCCLSGGVWSK